MPRRVQRQTVDTATFSRFASCVSEDAASKTRSGLDFNCLQAGYPPRIYHRLGKNNFGVMSPELAPIATVKCG
jgi:hypothetical protein